MGYRDTTDPACQAEPRGGRPRQVNMREVLNTLLYLNRSGCQWECSPRFAAQEHRV